MQALRDWKSGFSSGGANAEETLAKVKSTGVRTGQLAIDGNVL